MIKSNLIEDEDASSKIHSISSNFPPCGLLSEEEEEVNLDFFFMIGLVLRHVDFFAIDKPSGMISHAWSGPEDEENDVSVVASLRLWPEFASDCDSAPCPVHLAHRLDRSTSGLLLVGRSARAAAAVGASLASDSSSKVYIALCRGTTPDYFCVDRPLRLREAAHVSNKASGRAKLAKKRLKEQRATQDAVTLFVRVAICCDAHCSLVLAMPKTGRRHQIRRHLDGATHQVSGDTVYGPRGINALLRDEFGLRRLFLHSAHLSIDLGHEQLSLKAPLPEDLRLPLLRMPQGAQALAQLEQSLAQLDRTWLAAVEARCRETTLTATHRPGAANANATPGPAETTTLTA